MPREWSRFGQAVRGIGWRFQAACGWDEIRRALPRFRPDVIVLDLAMPEADGVQVLRHLAAERSARPLRVILISGADTRVLKSCRRLGMELVLDVIAALSKPIQIEDRGARCSRRRGSRVE